MLQEVISVIIKSIVVTTVFLLLVRSILSIPGFLPGYSRIKLLFRITEIFVRPVRTIIPRILWKNGLDYASLISALIILFLGFGLISFVNTMFNGFIK